MSTAPEPTDEEVAQALFVIGNGNGNPSSTFAAPEPPSASVPSIDGADHPATQNGESGPVDAESSYSAGFSAIDPALFPAEAAPADSGPSISAARGRGRGVRRGGAKRAQRQSRVRIGRPPTLMCELNDRLGRVDRTSLRLRKPSRIFSTKAARVSMMAVAPQSTEKQEKPTMLLRCSPNSRQLSMSAC